jgi:hypothetical protein
LGVVAPHAINSSITNHTQKGSRWAPVLIDGQISLLSIDKGSTIEVRLPVLTTQFTSTEAFLHAKQH